MAAQKITVDIVNNHSQISVAGGTTLHEIVATLADKLGFDPICARVNNKTESLDYAIYRPKTVEFLNITSDSGTRAYERSLSMMLYCATTKLHPGARLHIEHSIANGCYCRFEGINVDDATIAAIAAEMLNLHKRNLPFVRHERPRDEVIKLFADQGLDDKVKLLGSVGEPYIVYHTLDGTADSYYGCLAPTTGHIGVFALTPYREGALLRAFDPQNPGQVPPEIPADKLYTAFTNYVSFNNIIGVSNVGELNNVVATRRTSDLINVAEALHEKYIARISDDITARYHSCGTRLVFIAGPSSSGKTTFTKRLAVQLRTNLLKPILISLDNYFVNREHTPRDADGDYDYESLYALDLEQFNSDLLNIIAGRTVKLPTYSFETGARYYRGDTVQLDDNSIILIEGIHGLNPELTPAIASNLKYRVYVSALTTLSIDDHNRVPTTDTRLLRRIIRDNKYRGTSALETLRRWPSVRRGESRWIFPYQENADAMFNSSLLFELGVMKKYGEELLAAVPSTAPEYSQAYRLRKFLSYFRPIRPEVIPPTSLLREFLGGSSFHY